MTLDLLSIDASSNIRSDVFIFRCHLQLPNGKVVQVENPTWHRPGPRPHGAFAMAGHDALCCVHDDKVEARRIVNGTTARVDTGSEAETIVRCKGGILMFTLSSYVMFMNFV